MLWLNNEAPIPDTYVAFRGAIHLDQAALIELRLLAVSEYMLWIDGVFRSDGPSRFLPDYPEYDQLPLELSAGEHIIAIQVHYQGVSTRILADMPPFLFCQVVANSVTVPITWRCQSLQGYQRQVRRLSPLFGWIEWCDTRANPTNWQLRSYDDAEWIAPRNSKSGVSPKQPVEIGPVQHTIYNISPVSTGVWAEQFGYEKDDPPLRFFLRDLTCDRLPPTGVWRRYDLGRVSLGRPRVVCDLPAGTMVEIGYAESLQQGRVAPYITLSGGLTCNLDHFIARGGVQEFFPFHPKGGRFLELHISAPVNKVRILTEEYVERGYHGVHEGSFSCNDSLLNRIWTVGVETYRACAEDAIVDTPTRERGQWVGDAFIGGEIAAVAYRDLRLYRRSLVQAMRGARADGMVAGQIGGTCSYLASYAAQWVGACLRYYQLSGDQEFLDECFPYAVKNLLAFTRFVNEDGLGSGLPWSFIDWGYVRGDTLIDLAMNMHYIGALRAMVRICALSGHMDAEQEYIKQDQFITGCVERCLRQIWQSEQNPWQAIGYHANVLGLRLGLFPPTWQPACIAAIKTHMLNCFPNNPDAPRLSSPRANSPLLITPYFAHFTMPPLFEAGEVDFVLDQYRHCWGWALEQGCTTWLEVFDTRWSHCHQWAGAPTWQLSRYILGLHPRFDLGMNHFVLKPHFGSIQEARGVIPQKDGNIAVHWHRDGAKIKFELSTPMPVWLHQGQIDEPRPSLLTQANGRWQIEWNMANMLV